MLSQKLVIGDLLGRTSIQRGSRLSLSPFQSTHPSYLFSKTEGPNMGPLRGTTYRETPLQNEVPCTWTEHHRRKPSWTTKLPVGMMPSYWGLDVAIQACKHHVDFMATVRRSPLFMASVFFLRARDRCNVLREGTCCGQYILVCFVIRTIVLEEPVRLCVCACGRGCISLIVTFATENPDKCIPYTTYSGWLEPSGVQKIFTYNTVSRQRAFIFLRQIVFPRKQWDVIRCNKYEDQWRLQGLAKRRDPERQRFLFLSESGILRAKAIAYGEAASWGTYVWDLVRRMGHQTTTSCACHAGQLESAGTTFPLQHVEGLCCTTFCQSSCQRIQNLTLLNHVI